MDTIISLSPVLKEGMTVSEKFPRFMASSRKLLEFRCYFKHLSFL